MPLDTVGKTRSQILFYTAPYRESVTKLDFLVVSNSLDTAFVLPNLSQTSYFGNLLVNSDPVKALDEPIPMFFLFTQDGAPPN